MSVYIAPAAMGLGDLVVALPVVQSLIAQGEQVYLVVRLLEHLPLAHRISGLAGTLLEWELDPQRLHTQDSFYDLRDHYLQRRYWWGSREFEQAHPGYKINDILGIICSDLGLDVCFDQLSSLEWVSRPEARNTVLFIPGSAIDAKCWQTQRWLDLASQLRQQNLNVAVLGQPERSPAVRALVQQGLTHIPTPTIAHALDLISSSVGVVSVDTGLMHLAVHQGVPTVGIFRGSPVYIRPFSHFRAQIAAGGCLEACYQKETQCAHNHRCVAGPQFEPMNWSCQAPKDEHCLSTIEVAAVLAALQSVIKVPASV